MAASCEAITKLHRPISKSQFGSCTDQAVICMRPLRPSLFRFGNRPQKFGKDLKQERSSHPIDSLRTTDQFQPPN